MARREFKGVKLARVNGGGVIAPAQPKIYCTTNIHDFADFWPHSSRPGEGCCYSFQLADVLELQCETIVPARDAKPFFVAVFGRHDQPVVLLPLVIEPDRFYKRMIKIARILRFIDGGLSDYNAPVLFPTAAQPNEATVRTLWRSLTRVLPAFDIAIFEKMPTHVGDLRNPLLALGAECAFAGYAASLGDDWDLAKSRLSRRNVWKTRRFRDLGEVVLDLAATAEEYDRVLEILIEQKRRRNRETGKPDLFRKPGYIEYLKMAKRLLYPSGPVCLFSLRIRDEIVATSFGLAAGARFTGQLTGFAGEEWRAFSVGHLLHNKIFEWCFRQGFSFYDFGVGDESYKGAYCDVDIPLYRVEISASVRGRISVCERKLFTRLRSLKSGHSETGAPVSPPSASTTA